jgi:organic hydroperoxide reductase OsmC/OhrA
VHEAQIRWRLEGDFASGRYSRLHEIVLGNGPPASLAACHMLWFLHCARNAGLIVLAYEDAPEGRLEKDASGRMVMTRVTLRPRIAFTGESPSAASLMALHEAAHEACFLANSVKTSIFVEPRETAAA